MGAIFSRLLLAVAVPAAFAAPAWAQSNILTIVSGDGQTGFLEEQPDMVRSEGGTAKFGPLVVRLTDANGVPLAKQRIDFVCNSANDGPGPNQPGCEIYRQSNIFYWWTGADGTLSLNFYYGDLDDPNGAIAYGAAGHVLVTATAADAAPVTFRLNAVYRHVLTIASGNNQDAEISAAGYMPQTAAFDPLSVTLTAAGAPAANQTVTFTCASPNILCSLDGQYGSIDVTTDANGQATVERPVTAHLVGAFQVVAGTSAVGADPVTFDLRTHWPD